MYKAFLLGLALVTIPGKVCAQDPAADKKDLLQKIEKRAKELASKSEDWVKVSKDAKVLLEMLSNDTPELVKGLQDRMIPDDYNESLRRDAALLFRMSTEKPTAKDISRLRHAVASIHLKLVTLPKDRSKPLVVAWASDVPTKAPENQEAVFKSLENRLSILTLRNQREKITLVYSSAETVLAKAKEDVGYLRRLSEDGEKVGPDYLLSLAQDAHLFELASKDVTPSVVAAVYIEDAAEDIRTKAKSSGQAKKGPFNPVKTPVETKDPMKQVAVPDFEVWFTAKGLAGNPVHRQRFTAFSTPAIREMVPGTYVMWTKKGEQIGPEDDIDVVNNGKGECLVTLWTK